MFPHFPGVEMAVAFPPQKKKKMKKSQAAMSQEISAAGLSLLIPIVVQR